MANISDTVQIGPTAPKRPDGIQALQIAARTATLLAKPSEEYVAGAGSNWYLNMPHSLSWAIDDVTRDFGTDLYARMMLDPQVASVINVLKAAILNYPLEFRPAVDDEGADGYEIAKQLTDDAQLMFEEMDSSIDDVLWDMLDALPFGYRIAEQVFDLETTPSGRRQYTLSRLVPKPYDTAAFVVNPYNTVIAIAAAIPGVPFSIAPEHTYIDLENTPNILPRSKFAIMTFRPRNNDPRGQSVLRPAFASWNTKVGLAAEFVKYLSQFATPSLIGYTAEGADEYPLLDLDGEPITLASGAPVMQKPTDDMVAALSAFSNGTVTAFPYSAMTQVVNMSGEGAAFLNAMDLLDRQIAKSVLNQTLATEEGQHQAKSASTTHKDVLDSVVRLGKRTPQRMLRHDTLRVWMRLNGKEKQLALAPLPKLGTASPEDLARMWGALAALWNSSYLHESQLPATDDIAGLPKRTPRTAHTIPGREGIQVLGQEGNVEPLAGAVRDKSKPAAQEQINPAAPGDAAPHGQGARSRGD